MSQRKNKRRFKLFHLITLLMAIYVISVVWKQNNLMNELQSKKSNNMAEIEELEKEIGVLEEEIKDSQTLKFVEKVARDELGMVKPREIIVIDRNQKKNTFLETSNKEN